MSEKRGEFISVGVMCRAYSQAFNRLYEEICDKYKVGLFGTCSEIQSEADQSLSDWKLQHYQCMLGDNQNVVVQYLKKHYFRDLHIMDCPDRKHNELCRANFPQGSVQPAVLVFVGAQPVLVWSNRPSAANLNGSLGRPDVQEVWKLVADALEHLGADNNVKLYCSDGRELKQTGGCGKLLQAYCCVIQ